MAKRVKLTLGISNRDLSDPARSNFPLFHLEEVLTRDR
jgi:hypothetical protein